MKSMKEQIDEQPKIIKLFSINYARDLVNSPSDDEYNSEDRTLTQPQVPAGITDQV